MKVRRKGADDCCCNDWKNKIKELWEKYQDVVRGVKFGDNPVSWPDGDGIVQVDTEGLIDVDHTLNKNSINPVANAPVATAIESLEAKDIILEGDIQDVQGDIEDLGDRIDGIDDEIVTLGGRISTVDGKVDLQNSYNAATRAIANSAQQTAETFDDRLDAVEESDAIQDQQIAALQDADAENAKLAGDNAFTGNNSFAVNPKAAAPASGAVDTSIVNANWVSQTGAGAPNNLLHTNANETANGQKTFTSTINGCNEGMYLLSTPRVSNTTDYIKLISWSIKNLAFKLSFIGSEYNTRISYAEIIGFANPDNNHYRLYSIINLSSSNADKLDACITYDGTEYAIWIKSSSYHPKKCFLNSVCYYNSPAVTPQYTLGNTTLVEKPTVGETFQYVVDMVALT